MPGLTVNLFEDYAALVSAELKNAGYPIPSGSPAEVVGAYLNVQHRRVPIVRRAVKKAPYATPSHLQRGEKQLLSDVKAGRDLRKYQSTRLTKADFQDGMLNDFGIQHFHLGTKPHPKYRGFKSRTDPVLFALVRPNAFYAIGLYCHTSWSERKLLDIIHANWPEAIEMFVATESIELRHTYTDEEYAQLRKAKINTASARPDGTIHMPPGMGINAAGGSSLVTHQIMSIIGNLRIVQRKLAEAVAKEVLAGTLRYPIELHLLYRGEYMYAVGSDGVEFELGHGMAPTSI